MRIGVTSVPTLSEAINPMFWYLTVQFQHPCLFATFEDNGGVTTPIEAVIRADPHPNPIIEPVADFPFTYNGIPLDCGP